LKAGAEEPAEHALTLFAKRAAQRGLAFELERCRRAGLRGILIWETPPAGLPLYSSHYERFWAAAQDGRCE